jgi:hypothetical protein
MNTLDYALLWHDRGISPIPLSYRSKKPIVEWGQWVNALPPIALIKCWFRGMRNIAIVLGKDYVILDFDERMDYHRWRAQHGIDTYTVKSNRGYHVYLQIDEQTETAAMIGGEILAAGHMITVPDSVHKSGHQYAPINDYGIKRIESLAAVGIKPIEIIKHVVCADSTDNMSNRVWLPTGERYESIESPIERIKRSTSIASLLGQTNKNKSFIMLCPFHDDSTPSLQVWSDENKAYCHAPHCKAHRSIDVIDCAELLWRVDKKRAIGMLASQC